MGNKPSTVADYKKSDNGFYTLENAKIFKDDYCSSPSGIQTEEEEAKIKEKLMTYCPPTATKCDIEKDKEKNCNFLVINKDKVEGDYYRSKFNRTLPVSDTDFVYNHISGPNYDSSKPSYLFTEKSDFDKDLEEKPEKHRLKTLYSRETMSLVDALALSAKYGDNEDQIFENITIPSDWCLSIDPCPKGLECCKQESSSQSFFDKNKKLIIIGLVALIITGGIIYMFKRKNVDIAPAVVNVGRKRRSRK
jgi:hypothetical protein